MHSGQISRARVFRSLGVLAEISTVFNVLRARARGAGGVAALFLAATILSISATTPSHAITCSDRQQVCFRYCEKNYANAPRCRAACAQLLSTCMSTGCWESKVTARQCGITKQ
jgi:hypothetical protein